MKKIILLVMSLIILVFLFGCSASELSNDVAESNSEVLENQVSAWLNTELKDVVSGETYKISDFSGKRVLIESFAVWCPTCLKQQKIIAEMNDDEVIHIGLDTDPNEDESAVKNHALKHGFDWRFSVSPIELTKELVSQFGSGVVSAPSVPIIVVCEDGSSHLLGRGLKDAMQLKVQMNEKCE